MIIKKIVVTLILLHFTLLSIAQDPAIDYPYYFKSEGNPIVKHMRTADPSVRVWDDGKVWIYASHDMETATDYSSMDGYHVFSSYDLVNWTDHGEVLNSRNVAWGTKSGGYMWAPDCAYKNGKYYLYFPHHDKNGVFRTGVAISDKPEGPFVPEPNYIQGTSGIDPCCFIDDDGQAYLYFGNALVAKLKDNMTELAEEPQKISYGSNNFKEGPFMHKRNGIYYFSWTDWTGQVNQGYYAMGNNPYGPFAYKGAVNGRPNGAQDHHSILEYHGEWYYFYHVGNFTNEWGGKGGGNRRNICIDNLFYNSDGTMKKVVMTTNGVNPNPVGSAKGLLIPGKFNASQYYSENGTTLKGTSVESINNKDQLTYVIDVLGSDSYKLEMFLGTVMQNGKIDIQIDEKTISTVQITAGGNNISLNIDLKKGKHTFKLLFGNEINNMDIAILDSLNITSDINYYSVKTYNGYGGRFLSDSIVYIERNGDYKFKTSCETGYKVSDFTLDAVSKGVLTEYEINGIQSNHVLKANFERCQNIVKLYATVNNEQAVITNQITVTVGDKLLLQAESASEGHFEWTNSNSFRYEGAELLFQEITSANSADYQLVFVNNDGCKSIQNIKVNVTLPELENVIEAEYYSNQNGVQKENTQDDWGGQNIGFIHNGDWAEYTVTIDNPGEYWVAYRVASGTNGGSIDFEMNRVVLGTVFFGNTGGWQNWTTSDSIKVNLPIGTNQKILLKFKGNDGFLFNLNWFRLNLVTASALQSTGSEVGFNVYPNPASSFINIPFNLNYQILSATGRIILQSNEPTSMIDISKLKNDFYILKTDNITKKSFKISKM